MESFKVLTVEIGRKFARQARLYMLVYDGKPNASIPQKEIEKMRRQFRCHRDMGRSCIGFIESVWRWSIGIAMKRENFEEKWNKNNDTKSSAGKKEGVKFMEVI